MSLDDEEFRKQLGEDPEYQDPEHQKNLKLKFLGDSIRNLDRYLSGLEHYIDKNSFMTAAKKELDYIKKDFEELKDLL